MNLKKETTAKEPKEKEPKTKNKKNFTFDAAKLKGYLNKKAFLGITVVGAAILLVVYVYVYLDYTAKTDELTASNMTLQQEVNELQKYADNMAQYQSEIDEMRTAISDIMAEYPADAREEDIIMLAVQLQNRNVIAYDAINMEETEGVYTIPYDNVRLASIEGFDNDLIFTQKHAVYVNTTNYENLKSVIDQIYASKNRIGINSIVYAKNEENGTLEGNIDLYFYSAVGTDKEYELPDIAAYLAGTSDLFQSDKITAVNTAAEGEGEEAAEGNGAEEDGKTPQ